MSIVWGLEIKDSVSIPANAAAAAMGDAAQQAKTLAGAMKSAQSALTKANALGDVVNVRKAAANFHVLSEAYQKLPAEARAAADGTAALMAKQNAIVEAAQRTVAAEHEASEGARSLGESMTESVFKAELLKDALEELVKKGLEGIKEGFMFAIEASENLKRMTAQFDALGPAGQNAGAQTVAAIRGIAKEIPQSEAQIAGWARSLQATGTIRLDKLKDQIKAIAGADALGAVEGAGEATRSVLAKLNETSMKGGKTRFTLAELAPTGISEAEFLKSLGMTPANFEAAKKAGTVSGGQISDAITKAINIKSGGALAAQMDELSTIATKAKDGLTHLFEDVDVSPLTDGLKEFFSIFDAATPSGATLKRGITAAFKEIVAIMLKVRDGFLHLVIAFLETALFFKKHGEGIKAIVVGIGVALLVAFGPAALVAIATYTAAMVTAAIATIAANLPLILIAGAIGLITAAVIYFWPQIKKAIAAIGEFATKGFDMAVDFVAGLVGGFMDGVAKVENAASNMAHAALDAVRNIFKSHSPSVAAFELGGSIPEGLAGGIDAGSDKAAGASQDMAVNVMGRAAPRGGAGGAGGGGGGFSITIESFVIEAGHASSPGELKEMVEEGFSTLADRIALMIGSAPSPA